MGRCGPSGLGARSRLDGPDAAAGDGGRDRPDVVAGRPVACLLRGWQAAQRLDLDGTSVTISETGRRVGEYACCGSGGSILFAGVQGEAIFRVPAGGGTPEAVVSSDSSLQACSHSSGMVGCWRRPSTPEPVVCRAVPWGHPPALTLRELSSSLETGLLPGGAYHWPSEASPDGRTVLFGPRSGCSSFDLWSLYLDGSAPPRQLVATSGNDVAGRFSPDAPPCRVPLRRDRRVRAVRYVVPGTGSALIGCHPMARVSFNGRVRQAS